MIETLSQFAGNEPVRASVEEMLARDRVPQTLMIAGPVGSGRKTLAALIAAGLLCGGAPRPCGACSVCRLVQSRNHPDVIPVFAEPDKAAVGVNAVRALREQAAVMPNQGDRKVFILIDPLTPQAQNALLKILEEPPRGVFFLLLCQTEREWLETVRSRALLLRLGPVSFEQARPFLTRRGITPDDDARRALAAAGGLLGRLAVGDEPPSPVSTAVAACAAALAKKDAAAFLLGVQPVSGERAAYADFLDGLYAVLHAALTRRGNDAASPEAEELFRRLPGSELIRMGRTVAAARERLIFNPNGGLLFAALCAQLIHPAAPLTL